jgi:site-specific DNA recombinase
MESAKGGRFVYYNCGNFIRRGKSVCPGQRIPIDTLEGATLDHMANRLFTVERVKGILKGVYQKARKVTKSNEGERNSLIRQVEVVRAKLDRQYEAIETGAIDLALVAERIKELKDRRAQLTTRLEELKSPPQERPTSFLQGGRHRRLSADHP